MKYINKKLTIEKVSVENIARKYGTPAYCYSLTQLNENIKNFIGNFKSFSPLICFAIKSNTNVNLIREIKKFGLGADVVSMGELMIAIKAGINPKKIVFSGVGKTSNEINYAIDKKILLINTESKSEVEEINKIAKLKKRKVQIGIRLNPNTDAKTLTKISTGKKENKFGVLEKTFKTGESVEKAEISSKEMQFLYQQDNKVILMDTTNYEQFECDQSKIEKQVVWMKEGANYDIIFWEDTLITVEIDNFVDILVKDTDPGLKGDTATNTFKPAILENGIEIKVPLFISPGDFISVDTRSMEYQGRVNK